MFDASLYGIILLLARILFGGLLAFMGAKHFTNVSAMAEYVNAQGLAAARLSVLLSGSLLVLGGLGIVLGVYPVIAAGLVAMFFLIVTPVMHDFWTASDAQRQRELTHFLKNVELFAASLVFLIIGSEPWPYALNLRLGW